MGATNPAQADEGTIRKTFAESIEANSVHGSDSAENAGIEIDFFFRPEEIVGLTSASPSQSDGEGDPAKRGGGVGGSDSGSSRAIHIVAAPVTPPPCYAWSPSPSGDGEAALPRSSAQKASSASG